VVRSGKHLGHAHFSTVGGHPERIYYWSAPEHAKKLEFMIQAPRSRPSLRMGRDDEDQHLQRILDWCTEKEIECISVSLGNSSKNPTPWHIEMVSMPQLQPTYLAGPFRRLAVTRWRDVPKALGYKPLNKPFAERPHPFHDFFLITPTCRLASHTTYKARRDSSRRRCAEGYA